MDETTQVEFAPEALPVDPPASTHGHVDPAAEPLQAEPSAPPDDHSAEALPSGGEPPAHGEPATPPAGFADWVMPPAVKVQEWDFPTAASPDKPPTATALQPTPTTKKPKRPSRAPNTYQRDADTIREIFIDRLDTILMDKIDGILEPFDLRKHVTYDIVQAVQLALFPEEFGEPTDPAGMVPNSNPTRMPDAMWSARVQKFTAILQTTGDRGRRMVEGKIPIPLDH